jgi:hypothetical protein
MRHAAKNAASAGLVGLAIAMLSAQPARAADADAPPVTTADAQRVRMEQQLRELQTMRSEFDRRIRAIEVELHGSAAPAAETLPAPQAAVPVATQQVKESSPTKWGGFEPGKGLVLMKSDMGEVNLGVVSYMRYLNQEGLEDGYTDSFGRQFPVDPREDFQLAKVQLTFRGWLFDPRFNYNAYFWTSNSNQGQSAQVVGAGNLSFIFNSALRVYAGVHSVPSTRSTNRTFPYWLRNDNRPIADEFFRGSYTQGLWAEGKLARGLEYRAMIANNLSALGVNAGQLDAKPNTFSAALTWMPTTGEFGPAAGFGDFEDHQEVATLLSAHYTRSTETPQSQPGTESIENTQLRLSDGTLLFGVNAFNTPGRITEARYQMMALNAGLKYRGYSLEFEYYARWLDQFRVDGVIPVSDLFDSGFQLQAGAMLIPKTLQLYVSGSQIFGEYGNPYDVGIGVNWFPFERRDVRINMMGLYVDKSPVGYSAYPVPVGAEGFTFLTDFSLAF